MVIHIYTLVAVAPAFLYWDKYLTHVANRIQPARKDENTNSKNTAP